MKDMMNKAVFNLEDNEEMKEAFGGMEALTSGRWEISATIDEINDKRVILSIVEVTELGVDEPAVTPSDIPDEEPIRRVILGGDRAAKKPNP